MNCFAPYIPSTPFIQLCFTVLSIKNINDTKEDINGNDYYNDEIEMSILSDMNYDIDN